MMMKLTLNPLHLTLEKAPNRPATTCDGPAVCSPPPSPRTVRRVIVPCPTSGSWACSWPRFCRTVVWWICPSLMLSLNWSVREIFRITSMNELACYPEAVMMTR
uniref:Uncharacterized protein n=1 Tax=Cacopsylla melanoneura TaxID=428564 RepID=A0A8D8XL73_9HEMI